MSSWLFHLLPTPSLSNYTVWREEEVRQLLYTMVKVDWFRRGTPANPNKAGWEETGRSILRKPLKSCFWLLLTSLVLLCYPLNKPTNTYGQIFRVKKDAKCLILALSNKKVSFTLFIFIRRRPRREILKVV